MEYEEIREEVYRILQEAEGRFRTAYQIYNRMEAGIREQLAQEYPSAPGQPVMGAGAGTYYSPASFVSHALDYFFHDDPDNIMKAWFDSENIIFEDIEPGYREGWVTIWAWRPLFEESIG